MTTKALVLGASGATGRLLVMQLAERGIGARILVREGATLPEEILGNPLVETLRGNIAGLDDAGRRRLLRDCDAVVSCLGHNPSLRGLFGEPRSLVLDAVRGMCRAVGAEAGRKVKLVLMSSTACADKGAGESYGLAERILLSILRTLLPPHRDNARAAECLREEFGDGNGSIEWVALRPDTLVDEACESPYDVHGSPTRSPLFDAGTTRRINVGHFMAELLANEGLWREWRFRMPVVYDRARQERV